MILNVIKHPKDLKPHPLNIEIYGMEVADIDFVENIRETGIREPLVIKDDGTIISGHRRWMAAKDLKLDKVPCRIETYSNQIEEVEALLDYNRQREKTVSQRLNEKGQFKWIENEKEMALKRKQATQLKGKDSEGKPIFGGVHLDSTEKGHTRKKVRRGMV